MRLVEYHARQPICRDKGASAHGTQSTDTYSLKGLAEALDRIAKECQ